MRLDTHPASDKIGAQLLIVDFRDWLQITGQWLHGLDKVKLRYPTSCFAIAILSTSLLI